MKKIFVLLMSVLCFSIILSGCDFKNLAVPEEVSVKTNEKAVYEFPILSFDSTKDEKLDMSKYFDLEKLIKGDEEGSTEDSGTSFNIYKYNDGKSQFQQYLLHMPIKEIDFDFGSSFGDMDFSKAIEGFNIDKEFTIPDVGTIDEKKKVDMSSIETTLNKAVTFVGATSPLEQSVGFVGDVFESVEYSSGKLIIDTSYSDLNVGGGNVSGKMVLVDGEGNETSAVFKNNIAEIDISGKSLSAEGMKIRYENGFDYGITFIGYIKEDSKISKAKGVTIPSNMFTKPTANVTFPVSFGENLVKATVNEGTLKVVLATPETWSPGVIQDYNIEVTGGIECSVSKAHDTVDLAGKELKSDDINASAEVTVVLDNADIDFEDPPTVTVKTEIETISAVVKMGDDFDTTITQTTPIPSDLTDFVTSIRWSKLGFNVIATNNLPQGNDIQLKITSDFIGYTDNTLKTIESGKKDESGQFVEQKLEFINEVAEDANPPYYETPFTGANAKTNMDVSGQIVLNHDADNNLVVSNVSPGQTYNVYLKVEPVFEWIEADIKMPSGLDNFEGKFNTGINKKTMFKELGEDVAANLENIEFEKMPLYLFASLPNLDIFKNAGFSGVIKAFYGKETDETDASGNRIVQQNTPDKDAAYIFGEWDEENQVVAEGEIDLSGMSRMPELVKNEADEVINPFAASDMDFAEALNLTSGGDDTTLFRSSDVGLGSSVNGTMTVTSSDLEQAKEEGKCSIALDVAVIVTLNFNLKAPITLDIMDLIDSDEEGENGSGSSGSGSTGSSESENKDILNRTEPTSLEDYEKFLDVVDYASIRIENLNLPINGKFKLNVKMYDDDTSEPIVIANGKTLEIKRNPSMLLKQYPLVPDIKLEISDSFGLYRKAPVSGKLKLQVKANGNEIPIYPFTEKNEGGSN